MLQAQKAMWLSRILSDEYASWKAYIRWLASPLSINEICRCCVDPNDLPGQYPIFYHQVLNTWSNINIYHTVDSHYGVVNQFLWFNPNLKIGNDKIWEGYETWYENGICYIGNLIDHVNGRFADIRYLHDNFNIEVSAKNVMKLNCLISSIPRKW